MQVKKSAEDGKMNFLKYGSPNASEQLSYTSQRIENAKYMKFETVCEGFDLPIER